MKWFSLVLLLFCIPALGQQGYQIKVTLHPFNSGYLYLGHHFGKRQYLVDSARIQPNGEASFSGKEKLFGGVYLVVYPKKDGWFEMIIDDQQQFEVEADTANLLQTLKFQHSPDNDLFHQYQLFSYEKGKTIMADQNHLASATSLADSTATIAQIKKLNEEVKTYREDFIIKHPGHLLTAIFNVLKEPEVPPANQHPGGKYDTAYAYQYYKSHYWDGVSFTDERLVRTPVLQVKLDRYFDNVLVQQPDSLSREADRILDAAKPNQETFKFYLSSLTEKYVNPSLMGQDAVFVHLFQRYYTTGEADYWMNEKYKKFVFDRGYSLMANLIGEKAANMELLDTSGKSTPLYAVQANYTIICFWDPTCSHCQVEVPKLDSLFQGKWKGSGVKIYGVMTDGGKEAWMDYIHEHNLKDWIHVYQTQEMKEADYKANRPGFRQLYDVFQTPTLYLLDKNKRIIAKKLNYQQLDEFLDYKMKSAQTN